MSPNDADGMANSVDPDLTASLEEQSDLGLHCFPRPICPNNWDHYSISNGRTIFTIIMVQGIYLASF